MSDKTLSALMLFVAATWRKDAASFRSNNNFGHQFGEAVASTFETCAVDLERALAAYRAQQESKKS
jgi:hypothetical protein